ncbi:helix-turn-helix transcriptional regulator [Thermoleophilia bacterium SCSIO 60948]|nr:helix-turn-helix transcriptional regulator [Thermoleophilia bacterium SCSIO 60948]
MLRARDAIDRRWAEPIDIEALARIANCSRAHFIRAFGAAFGETPHRYLQRRRIERAMWMLRERAELSVTEVSLEVGFASLGSFSRTFAAIVGASPSEYRRRATPAADDARLRVPTCAVTSYERPVRPGPASAAPARGSRTFGEDRAARPA